MRTKFLRFISEDANGPVLKDMRFQQIRAGTRFITQEQTADAAYIIQRGTCQLVVEKKGELHPVDHRGEGDIVGVMAILTGEPRRAHVEAKTIASLNHENIIIQPDAHLKILDFGLACPIGTQDFSSLGTLAYMAPEQIAGDPMDPRTDIFAVGITAYEMLVGQQPFDEDDPSKLEKLRLHQDIPDPMRSAPNLSRDLCEFIIKSCRCDPNLRYADMNQALADLKRIAEALEVPR